MRLPLCPLLAMTAWNAALIRFLRQAYAAHPRGAELSVTWRPEGLPCDCS